MSERCPWSKCPCPGTVPRFLLRHRQKASGRAREPDTAPGLKGSKETKLAFFCNLLLLVTPSALRKCSVVWSSLYQRLASWGFRDEYVQNRQTRLQFFYGQNKTTDDNNDKTTAIKWMVVERKKYKYTKTENRKCYCSWIKTPTKSQSVFIEVWMNNSDSS